MAASKVKGPAHNEHRYLNFIIQHEEALNVKTEVVKELTNINRMTTKTTWNRVRKPFLWSITRPETGQQKISRTCAFCKERLAIQVISLEKIAALQKRDRILRIAGRIGIPVFLVVIVACFATQKFMAVGAASIFGLLLSFLFSLSYESAGVNPGFWEEGGLTGAYWQQKGPFDGHYIETVESFTDEKEAGRVPVLAIRTDSIQE